MTKEKVIKLLESLANHERDMAECYDTLEKDCSEKFRRKGLAYAYQNAIYLLTDNNYCKEIWNIMVKAGELKDEI